jgi:hypothetical protein
MEWRPRHEQAPYLLLLPQLLALWRAWPWAVAAGLRAALVWPPTRAALVRALVRALAREPPQKVPRAQCQQALRQLLPRLRPLHRQTWLPQPQARVLRLEEGVPDLLLWPQALPPPSPKPLPPVQPWPSAAAAGPQRELAGRQEGSAVPAALGQQGLQPQQRDPDQPQHRRARRVVPRTATQLR